MKVVAIFDVDEDKLSKQEVEGASFESEIGWARDSGIYLEKSYEIREENWNDTIAEEIQNLLTSGGRA